MTYFSRRNNHAVEFSGYEEVSSAMRARLRSVISKYVQDNGISYSNDDPWFVEPSEFQHEVEKEFPGMNVWGLIDNGAFHHIFTVIEIFLNLARGVYYTNRASAPYEIQQTFDLSGSVYTVKNGQVELRVTRELATKVEEVKVVLEDNISAYKKFFEAAGDLVGRKAKPEDVIKDIFVAFEDYLKVKTGSKEYSAAISQLQKSNLISSTQKQLLEKLYAYRSDTYGVGHAGNGSVPGEIDAIWFLETVSAQLTMIHNKLQQQK